VIRTPRSIVQCMSLNYISFSKFFTIFLILVIYS
jgi:hypothetical protein